MLNPAVFAICYFHLRSQIAAKAAGCSPGPSAITMAYSGFCEFYDLFVFH